MVKRLERYKKFVSIFAIILMGTAMLFNIVYYGFCIHNLQKEKYYLARTRYNVTKEINFEQIKVNEVKYFLYRNRTAGATDAGEDLNNYIVSNINEICNNTGVFLTSYSK